MRAPFLGYRLIEFAFGKVPSHLKATAQDKKILLKRLTARVLPPEFDQLCKLGSSIPLGVWPKGMAFMALFNEGLRDPACSIDAAMLHSLLRGQGRGWSNRKRLLALLLFELWWWEFRVMF